MKSRLFCSRYLSVTDSCTSDWRKSYLRDFEIEIVRHHPSPCALLRQIIRDLIFPGADSHTLLCLIKQLHSFDIEDFTYLYLIDCDRSLHD